MTNQSAETGMAKLIAGAKRKMRKLRDNVEGVISIEFACVAPFMIASMLGIASIIDTERSTTRIGKVTATVADIIAQAPVVNGEFINGAFDAGKAMLGEFDNANMKIYVAGVRVNNDRSTEVIWICSRNFGNAGGGPGAELELPQRLRDIPGFVVVSYAEFQHMPVHGAVLTSEPNVYKYHNYFVPRVSLETLREGECDG